MRKKKFLKFGFNALSVVLAAGMLLVSFVSCDKGNENENGGKNTTVNGVSFEMVNVEGGTFTMGATAEQGNDAPDSEKPTHQVTLSAFSIGKTEVTQELWQAVMGKSMKQWIVEKFPDFSNGYVDSLSSMFGNNHPVHSISWYDIVGIDIAGGVGYTINGVSYYKDGFCYKLSQLAGGGKQFRLPTEAEWEYAARGGNKAASQTKYSGSDNIDKVAWYCENIPSQVFGVSGYGAQSVAQKKANALGLYDMSGNVWEWCSDWYGEYSSEAQTNPTGADGSGSRVLRGGNWDYVTRGCRVSYRSYSNPDDRISGYIGFRLAL